MPWVYDSGCARMLEGMKQWIQGPTTHTHIHTHKLTQTHRDSEREKEGKREKAQEWTTKGQNYIIACGVRFK